MSFEFVFSLLIRVEKTKTPTVFRPQFQFPHHRVKDHRSDRAALADSGAVTAEEPEPGAAPERRESRRVCRDGRQKLRVRGAGVQSRLELELREAARVCGAAEGVVDGEVGVGEGDVAVRCFPFFYWEWKRLREEKKRRRRRPPFFSLGLRFVLFFSFFLRLSASPRGKTKTSPRYVSPHLSDAASEMSPGWTLPRTGMPILAQ